MLPSESISGPYLASIRWTYSWLSIQATGDIISTFRRGFVGTAPRPCLQKFLKRTPITAPRYSSASLRCRTDSDCRVTDTWLGLRHA